MDEPKSLESIFKEKIFRIPDYQRGYAWQPAQLKDFWEDLVNLSRDRAHYTGVLTLKQVPPADIPEVDKEYWLVDDHGYRVHQVVDGQQRLTTFIIFLQAFVEYVRELPAERGKPDTEIYITDSLSIADLQARYLFRVKPTGDRFRTYKFGYTHDNPSHVYLRYKILGEEGGGAVDETFYTLNLANAKRYFRAQLGALAEQAGLPGLQEIYRKLTKQFLFNEYIMKDEFDVFVAFETMNNRGKKLSDLELLKNRLIYLTTLYDDTELDAASRLSLRETVNDGWKEVYHQLGRNASHPLNDDDFLRAHWTMYFKYSRKTGQDYIHFLLDEQFTPRKVLRKVARPVVLDAPREVRSTDDVDDGDEDATEEAAVVSAAQLEPVEIRDFVHSLRDSAVHWFNSFYPELADGMSSEERLWISNLNRVGMGYFRPLVMAILKNERAEAGRIRAFRRIERFVFIAFRLTSARANYASSTYYNAARQLDRDPSGLQAIEAQMDRDLAYAFNDDGILRSSEFHDLIYKRVVRGGGYYGWSGLRYFLFEYETSLLSESRQTKVKWEDLLTTEKDKVSIEHIYPQTETAGWAHVFSGIEPERRQRYGGSVGNLLLLSMSINSSLQNDDFADKKHPKRDSRGEKIRNGYSDGSHSEIEVSKEDAWGPEQVRARGLRLLKFMERRWGFTFATDDEREALLFLD